MPAANQIGLLSAQLQAKDTVTQVRPACLLSAFPSVSCGEIGHRRSLSHSEIIYGTMTVS